MRHELMFCRFMCEFTSRKHCFVSDFVDDWFSEFVCDIPAPHHDLTQRFFTNFIAVWFQCPNWYLVNIVSGDGLTPMLAYSGLVDYQGPNDYQFCDSSRGWFNQNTTHLYLVPNPSRSLTLYGLSIELNQPWINPITSLILSSLQEVLCDIFNLSPNPFERLCFKFHL